MINQSPTRNLLISKIVSVAGNALMLLCIFLPYASAGKDSPYRIHADETLDGIRAGELADPSMLKFLTFHNKLKGTVKSGSAIATIVTILVAVIAVAALLSIMFACLSKGIPALIFSLISFGAFLAMNWDFTDRGVVPSDEFSWGFGYYLFFVATLAAVVGAVWLIIAKHRSKRTNSL